MASVRSVLDAACSPRRTLVEHASTMRPGLYVKRGQLLRHASARVPTHLLVSKGQRARPKPNASRQQVLRSHAVALVGTVLSGVAFVPSARGDAGGASILVTAKGGALLIDSQGGSVIRTSGEPLFTERYEGMRHWFQGCVPSPAFSVAADRCSLVESYVEGDIASSLDPRRQLEVCGVILRSYTRLAGTSCPASEWQRYPNLLPLLSQADIPSGMRSHVDPDFLVEFLPEGLVVPSQGDMGLDNVMVTRRRALVIDLAPQMLNLRPFWFDAVTLVLRSSRSEFIDGRWDRALCELWDEAGAEPPDFEHHRKRVMAGCALWLTWRKYGAHQMFDRNGFRRRLALHWTRMDPGPSPSGG